MFLATLQLANSYSVEVVSSDGLSVSDQVLKLVHTSNRSEEDVGGKIQQLAITTPKKVSKRSRIPNTTPKSARRPPLRPRLLQ